MEPANLRLRRPPIVEAYIRFEMTAGEAERQLSQEDVQAFVNRRCSEYRPKETRWTRNVSVKWPKSGPPKNVQLSQRFERIRACDEQELRWIQVGSGFLIHNVLKKTEEQDYAGFTTMEEEALRVLMAYADHFGYNEIQAMAVHYVDLAVFAKSLGNEIEDYLRIRPAVPGEFGAISGFAMKVSPSPTATSGDIVDIAVRRETDADDGEAIRVRIEWDAKCTTPQSLDRAGETLERLHTELLDRFRVAFTEKAMSVFGPVEE